MVNILHDVDFSAEIAAHPGLSVGKCDNLAIIKYLLKTFYIMPRVAMQNRAAGPTSDFSAEISWQEKRERTDDSESSHGF